MSELILYLESWNNVSLILRLLLAVLFGSLIGLERAAKRQIAGVKTFSLVCLGSALATIVNIYLWHMTAGSAGPADVARIPAGVISGVGFLGAGAIIITHKNQVRGLTTAAGLWASAALGIAVGSGMLFLSTLALLLIIVSIHFLPYLDTRQREFSRLMGLYLEVDAETGTRKLMQYLQKRGYSITSLEKQRLSKSSDLSVLLELNLGQHIRHQEVIADLSHLDGIRYLEEI